MNPNSQHLQVQFRSFITILSIKMLQHFITAYSIIWVKRLMQIRPLALLLVTVLSITSLRGEEINMSGSGLEKIIREVAGDSVNIQSNIIEFSIKDVPLLCIYDETHNRMRIISPIKEYAEVSQEEKDKMLVANFHNALDARYAVSQDTLYSVYLHPLSTLQENDVLAGVYQVISLNLTFGKEYSSGLLTFGKEYPSLEDNEPI